MGFRTRIIQNVGDSVQICLVDRITQTTDDLRATARILPPYSIRDSKLEYKVIYNLTSSPQIELFHWSVLPAVYSFAG